MSISIGAIPQLNHYYRPQTANGAAAQSQPQNSVSSPASDSQSSEIKDKNDPNYVCQTCKSRKYQDQSNDPGVSFKAPAHISASSSASVVASHEQEHVTNEQVQAKGEGRKVVSQTVTLHYAVCPECHKSYVAGGTTRTVTASDNQQQSSQIGNRLDVKV